jgi:hypothetical protein
LISVSTDAANCTRTELAGWLETCSQTYKAREEDQHAIQIHLQGKAKGAAITQREAAYLYEPAGSVQPLLLMKCPP